MQKIQTVLDLDRDADDVWSVLGDVAAVHRWLPGFVATRMEGDLRVCTMADGTEVREEIVEHSDRSRRYSYRHLRTLLPVRESTGTFRVERRPGGSRVVWDAEIEPLDPASADEVTAMVAGAFQESLDALGGYLAADADRSA